MKSAKSAAKRPTKKATSRRASKKAQSKPKTEAQGYLHGYSKEEQLRLYQQARFLEGKVYEHVDLTKMHSVLEIGSGVGAQTEILLERFPQIKITCVDTSKAQLAAAEKHLKKQIADKRVELIKTDGGEIPFDDSTFDAVFICWLLEHVANPKGILNEAKRLLKSSGKIICTEVMNATLYLHPYSPATLQYWFAFNDHQWNLEGDPFIGAKVAGLLHDCGFHNIKTRNLVFHYDSRSPKMRKLMFEYWTNLLLSGAPSLVKAGRVDQTLVEAMREELSHLKDSNEAVFYYAAMQIEANVY